MIRNSLLILFLSGVFTVSALAQTADSPWLYGIHWYLKTDSLSVGAATDVESMTGGKGVWVLEITHVDASKAPAWDQPGYFVGHCQKVVTGKGHSMIFRVQPYWSRNVPHSSDPYTLANYAADAQAAANTLKDYCHIWAIGNEVNLDGENMRYNSSTGNYDTSWQPTPQQYADAYVAVRDAIHNVTPNTTPARQICLMQPVSPGNIISGTRFMDGNEFLWRQIDAVADKSKIDGFALHSYAEPGGANYGVDGFFEALREQIMIIDQFGLGDRPIYITEWNKHMPNSTEAQIGAKFLHRALTALNDWNTGSGGEWAGQPNHNIVGTTWFVYPKDFGWDEYALQYWKSQIASTDKELNPWYSFLYACGLNYAKGVAGTGPTVPQSAIWWEDDFNGTAGAAPDTASPAPDWKVETTGSGSASLSGDGALRLLGNSSVNGGAGIRTAGYAYGNFRLAADITFTNAARSSTSVSEANADIRIREGSKGYSLTFFTTPSPTNSGRIILRRTNDWTQIGSYNVAVTGGINSGDSFHLEIVADGSDIAYKVYKNGGTTPVVDWNVSDSGQKVGWVRLMTYNLQEARINKVVMAGPQYTNVRDWVLY